MSAYQLDGIYEWAARPEWRHHFIATHDRNVGIPTEQAGAFVEDLPQLLGEHWVLTLTGWSLEDLMSQDLGGRNICDDYLKHRGRKESAANTAYIEALRKSSVSLYEVSDIVIDQGFLLRDLVNGGDPVRVSERSATHSLKQWDRIATRVVVVDGRTLMSGAGLIFPADLASQVLVEIRRGSTVRLLTLPGLPSPSLPGLPKSPGLPGLPRSGGGAVASNITVAGGLRKDIASILSAAWLRYYLGRALNPTLPKLANTSGEDLEFNTIRYPLRRGATPAEVVAALDQLRPLARLGQKLSWDWLEQQQAKPRRKKTSKSPMEAMTIGGSAPDGRTILGHVDLEDKAIVLMVNSAERAERGMALFGEVLAGLVGKPRIERMSVEEAMEKARREPAAPKEALSIPPEEERRIIHETLTKHYRKTLSDRIGMLDNQSPRAAVKTPEGREKVIAWLKYLENSNAGSEGPMSDYDFTWMWEELGIAELRR